MRACVLAIAGSLAAPSVAWAQPGWESWGHPSWGHPMWGMWGAWGLVMMLMMLVFWGLIIAGLVLAIRWLMSPSRHAGSDAALDILRQRYARGEIDREEFLARKRDL
jgi:putative membrane protein